MESALDELIIWAPDVGDAGLFDTADSLLHDYMGRWPEIPYTDLDYWEELCERVQTLWESYEDRLRQVGCDFDPCIAEERSYQARMREAEEIKRGEPDV
jgi:predicted PolB exonuclease-like 3'-5' exonuclease